MPVPKLWIATTRGIARLMRSASLVAILAACAIFLASVSLYAQSDTGRVTVDSVHRGAVRRDTTRPARDSISLLQQGRRRPPH